MNKVQTKQMSQNQKETNKSFHIGFDQAIINTGAAVLERNKESDSLKYVHSELFSSQFKWRQKSDSFILLEQASFLKTFLKKYSDIGKINSIAIEGVSLGSPGGASSRGAIWGLFVTTCLQYADTVVVSPLSLKVFVADSGLAEKKDIQNIIIPKYGLDKLNRKIYDDETDALGLAETGFWAWRIMNEGIDKIEDKLKPHELKVLWNEKKNDKGLMKGICNRLDDLYLRRI